jgi:hypothetical protein
MAGSTQLPDSAFIAKHHPKCGRGLAPDSNVSANPNYLTFCKLPSHRPSNNSPA